MELKIESIKRCWDGCAIQIYFGYNNQKAYCVYTLFGDELGIDECNYKEGDKEHIMSIVEWLPNAHYVVDLVL